MPLLWYDMIWHKSHCSNSLLLNKIFSQLKQKCKPKNVTDASEHGPNESQIGITVLEELNICHKCTNFVPFLLQPINDFSFCYTNPHLIRGYSPSKWSPVWRFSYVSSERRDRRTRGFAPSPRTCSTTRRGTWPTCWRSGSGRQSTVPSYGRGAAGRPPALDPWCLWSVASAAPGTTWPQCRLCSSSWPRSGASSSSRPVRRSPESSAGAGRLSSDTGWLWHWMLILWKKFVEWVTK